MTKVGRLYEIEKEEAVKKAVQDMQQQLMSEKEKTKTAESKTRTAELKVCILQMLLKGNTIAEAAEKLHMKPSDAARLIAE